jgi:pimeloyl-ACP methyl ester carboxylesterase
VLSATINGVKLEYIVQGRGEPVVLIHGGIYADSYFPLMAQSLLTNHYRMINYHRRGFAGSTHQDSVMSIRQQAADCNELMETLNIDRAHIVGHSYGGTIALQLAIDAPNRIHTLSLLEPGLVGHVQGVSELIPKLESLVNMYKKGNMVEAIDSFCQLIGGSQYRRVVDNALPPGAFDLAVADGDTFFKVEQASLQSWGFTPEDASSITQPVLSVLGTNSERVFQEIHELILSWIPHVEALILPNSTHMLHMMNPKGMAEGLEKFFSRHPLP